MKKFIVLSMLLLSISLTSFTQTAISAGNISGLWTKAGSPYLINGDLTIPSGALLTIEPGVSVIFQGSYKLRVSGYLNATGTNAENIIFTINDTTGFSDYDQTTGGWQGFKFDSYSTKTDTSYLVYCQILYSKEEGAIILTGGENLYIKYSVLENNYARWGGGIRFSGRYGGSLTVLNSTFRNNVSYSQGGGINIGENYTIDKVRIENNLFEYNSSGYGGGIYLAYGSAIIENNTFRENYAYRGGAICIVSSFSEVVSNTIVSNSSEYSGAGIYIENNSNPQIINNIIINNSAPSGSGIFITDSKILLLGNIISNNQGQNGGGFTSYRSENTIVNNTISHNLGHDGGGLYFNESNTNIINSILWNNSGVTGKQIFISDNLSSPEIENSLVEGGIADIGTAVTANYIGSYLNNIETDPLFLSPSLGYGVQVDAETANWSIQSLSPCVNKGKENIPEIEFPEIDVYGSPRIKYSNIDIGAAEKEISSITFSESITSDISLTADTIFVNGNIFIPDDITLTISSGSKVLFLGHYYIEVEGTIICKGTEKERISFSRKDTTGFSDYSNINGSWSGIIFDNGGSGANGAMADNDSSIFLYCDFQHVKDDNSKGCLWHNYYSKVKYENCIIENNAIVNNPYGRGGAGIYCSHSNPEFLFSSIRNNYSTSQYNASNGGAIYLNNSSPRIEQCIIENNTGGHGGGIWMSNSGSSITDCNIINNTGGDGGGIYAEYSDAKILNSRICNNYASGSGAAIESRFSSLTILNNLIANNSSLYNGGLYFYNNENLNIANNTISNNYSEWGNNLINFNYSSGLIQNNIIWGSNCVGPFYASQAALVFKNCIIENFQTGYDSYSSFILEYENIYETDPLFLNESEGIGYNYSGTEADWRLLKTSLGINGGLIDSANYLLADRDLNTDPRINYNIDMGAYEDQGAPPVFEIHPVNQFKCSGDQSVFEVMVNDTVNYVWKKDGEPIANSNMSKLVLNDISISDQGNYQCFISNGYGEFLSNSAFLQVNESPEILVNLNDSWAEKEEQTTLEIYARGTNINYQWQKDDVNIENAKSPKLILNNIGYSDEGKYRCVVSNSCDIDSSNEVSLFLAPQICLVTVSPVSGNNLIVWEKNSIAPVLYYNIYRESSVAGIYDLLGSVASGDLSVYIDNEAEPTSQAYIYKVTAIDENLEETEISLCKPHKTIHLLVSTNVELNSSQLEWDNYYGFDYNSYNIYKSTTGSGFELAHTIASTHNSWTDPISSDTPVFYRISVMKPDACLPTGGSKKSTEVYDNSVSNMDNSLKEQGEINHAPTDILLNNSSIAENQNIGSLIGRFSAVDEDIDDIHSYKLSAGIGDEDNYSFTIISDLLLSAESFDYENKNSYSIRIKAIDNGEDRLSIEKVMQVDITDVLETTGMDDKQNVSDLRIFPNPFSESTRIQFYNPEEKECIISISDLSGKKIRNYISHTNYFIIERENMSSGVYIIEIRGEKILRGRLVVL